MKIPWALMLVVVGTVACSRDDGGTAVVPPEMLEPELVHDQQPDAVVEELARQGRCEELHGERQRYCLERAQYLPEHAQGPPDEPGLTRRLDQDQVDTDPARRVLEPQDSGRSRAHRPDLDDDVERDERDRRLDADEGIEDSDEREPR